MSTKRVRCDARKKLRKEDWKRSRVQAEIELSELAEPPEDTRAWLDRRAQEILEGQRAWRKSFLERRKGLPELPKGTWRRMWRGTLWQGGPTHLVRRRRPGKPPVPTIFFDDFKG